MAVKVCLKKKGDNKWQDQQTVTKYKYYKATVQL
jgi:hypothetical protein